MSGNWKPPKGINVVYKGRGFRKKGKPQQESEKTETKTNDEEKSED
jgi:hypothetical protein